MLFGAAKTMETSINKQLSVEEAAPAVSIITPAYKVAGLIGPTIDSVFAQTFQDFEWIIVNDGSPDTDELESKLAPIIDRIVYLKQENAGAAIARNTGIEAARGRYLAFLDGDDIWSADYLQSQLRLIDEGSFDMVYCNAELFGESASFGDTFMHQAPSSGPVTVASLLDLRCSVITSGTVVRKNVVDEVGRFENDRVQSEDFHLWMRIARAGYRIGYSTTPKLRYRVTPTGLSGDAEDRIRRAIDVFQRVGRDIELSAEESAILQDKIGAFEADLDVVVGKRFLLSGDFHSASDAFDRAKRRRWSARVAAAAVLTKVAPRMVTSVYKRLNRSDAAFVASR